MQKFEKPHAAREPQFGHPCYIPLRDRYVPAFLTQ